MTRKNPKRMPKKMKRLKKMRKKMSTSKSNSSSTRMTGSHMAFSRLICLKKNLRELFLTTKLRKSFHMEIKWQISQKVIVWSKKMNHNLTKLLRLKSKNLSLKISKILQSQKRSIITRKNKKLRKRRMMMEKWGRGDTNAPPRWFIIFYQQH